MAAAVTAVLVAGGPAAACGTARSPGADGPAATTIRNDGTPPSPALGSPRTAATSPSAEAGSGAAEEMTTPAGRLALATRLRIAVEKLDFGDGLVDRLPPGARAFTSKSAGKAPPSIPNVDVAVIELDSRGRPRAAANVLVSRRYPDGAIVPVDRNLGTTQVRWRRWNTAAWEAGSAGSDDVVAGRQRARLEMMSPYPASVLKLMVAFGVLRLVDRGELTLDAPLPYAPPTDMCGKPGRATVAEWLDQMITVSDNQATCALVKKLHDLDAVRPLNGTFAKLGLRTLQVRNTDPATGGDWLGMSMSALDTARLLLLVSGAPGELWRTPAGRPVTAQLLSSSSRAFLLHTLADQGLNQALSTTNWCGRAYPAPGIPHAVPDRWINHTNGSVTADGRYYAQDVRPCNATAEVTFAHKTGLSNQAGADAGIVRSLPGQAERRYIVAVFTNLGLRFADADQPPDRPGVFPVSYTEKIAKLGHDIDRMMTGRAR